MTWGAREGMGIPAGSTRGAPKDLTPFGASVTSEHSDRFAAPTEFRQTDSPKFSNLTDLMTRSASPELSAGPCAPAACISELIEQEGEYVDSHRDAISEASASVSGRRARAQQHGPFRGCRRLEPRGHFARMHRINPRIVCSSHEENGRIPTAIGDPMVRGVGMHRAKHRRVFHRSVLRDVERPVGRTLDRSMS